MRSNAAIAADLQEFQDAGVEPPEELVAEAIAALTPQVQPAKEGA